MQVEVKVHLDKYKVNLFKVTNIIIILLINHSKKIIMIK